ncbi:unnamed protein product [Staurois parvus]|uniref:Uncharacterized protein n=1 Tax=Staurois parvus TaxID=386267 RepID=A0ABN9BGQ8_9NEOB|nr:unnamed protein product [Staurois parvus]
MQCPKKMTEVWHHCNLSLETLQPLFSQVVALQTLSTLSCSHWVVVKRLGALHSLLKCPGFPQLKQISGFSSGRPALQPTT